MRNRSSFSFRVCISRSLLLRKGDRALETKAAACLGCAEQLRGSRSLVGGNSFEAAGRSIPGGLTTSSTRVGLMSTTVLRVNREGLDSGLSRCHIPCMTDKASRKHRPRDANQLAKRVVDMAVGVAPEDVDARPDSSKDPAAVALGRKGGAKGGPARARSLTAEERREIAYKAARARWSKRRK